MAQLFSIRMKRLGVLTVSRLELIIFLLLVGALGGACLYLRSSLQPPRESKLIASFNGHRPAFERLREMLLEDQQLSYVAIWGVMTKESGAITPHGHVSIDRYNEYLALFGETGGRMAYRKEGTIADVSIEMWVSGFVGDTRHVAICWKDREPANQVASLEDFYSSPEPRTPVFKHIDGNWFLWADW